MKQSSAQSPSRWLTSLRLLALVYIIYSILTVIVSLPAKYDSLLNLNPGTASSSPFYGWTSRQIQSAAVSLGISPKGIAGVELSASLICLLCFWAVAGLLFWRKSGTWTGLLAAYILFATAPGLSGLPLIGPHTSLWAKNLNTFLATVNFSTLFTMLYIFPNGRVVPRFTRFLFPVPYLLAIAGAFNQKINALGTPVVVMFLLGGLASQVYRFRKVSSLEERQQTKWVVYAAGMLLAYAFFTPLLLTFFPNWIVGSAGRFWYELLANRILGSLFPALLPLAIGISILRYRLFDIDLIIRKTLQYTLISGLMALLFLGSVTILQAVFTALGGAKNPFVTVISTLVIAAAFNPLRRRMQGIIDQRFYRRRYNAEQALAQFADTARSETDLAVLTGNLVNVVEETMQPEHLVLWLRSTVDKRVEKPG